jgi:hypothetical protein
MKGMKLIQSIDFMKVGTRVICVDDSVRPEMIEWQRQYCPNWVKKDAEYTIREFDNNDGIVDGVLLEEIENKPIFLIKWNRLIEPRFATWRFREMEDDIQEADVSEEEFELMKTML